MFELSPYSTIYSDLQGNIISCNQRFIELHAIKGGQEAQVGRNVSEFFPEDERSLLFSTIEKAIEERQPQGPVEYTMLREDGTRFQAETWNTQICNSEGEPLAMLAYAHDITERKRNEELVQLRLRLSEFAAGHSLIELLQEMLDGVERLTGSQMGFFHFMEEDQQTLSSQAWSTRTVREFCTARRDGSHYDINQAGVWVDCVRQRQTVIHNDYAALPHRKGLPEGHAPVIRELVVPIFRGGKIVAILGVGNKPSVYTQADLNLVEHVADVVWEIAARKQAEIEREKLRASLAQSDRLASMGMLAAGVAHEINNPLAYVLYNLESLTEDLPLLFEQIQATQARQAGAAADDSSESISPEMIKDLVERAREAASGARRIKEIARGLGAFSRVEQHELSQVNLHSAIEHAVSMASNEIKYRARLVKDFGQVPSLLASEGRLAQVVLNLLVNAAHTIDEGDVEHNQIKIRTWSAGQEAFFEVSDTGKGIPPENLERLFEPFFTTKPVGVGSGLGLSICKNIVNGYSGDIKVQSKVGQGTCFTISLPIKRVETGPVETRRTAEPEAAVVRGRVLVIDDEAPIRSLMERLLGKQHEVVKAESGAAAIELLEHDQSFDLIICDMMMPAVSGMDLHKWLVDKNPELAKNVLFITGGAFTPKTREYLAQIDNLRVEKPFDSKDLQHMVNELISATRAKAPKRCH